MLSIQKRINIVNFEKEITNENDSETKQNKVVDNYFL